MVAQNHTNDDSTETYEHEGLQPQAIEYTTSDYIKMWGVGLLRLTSAVVALYIIHDLTHYVI